jgi:hypothetical protein
MAKNTNNPKDTRPDAVARMIDLSDDPCSPSIQCPFSYKGELCEISKQRCSEETWYLRAAAEPS